MGSKAMSWVGLPGSMSRGGSGLLASLQPCHDWRGEESPRLAILFLLLLFAVIVPIASIELRFRRILFGALPNLP